MPHPLARVDFCAEWTRAVNLESTPVTRRIGAVHVSRSARGRPNGGQAVAIVAVAKTMSRQIASFLAKYDPEIAADARASRSKLSKMVPGGVEFVYDNYNALVFGYGP